MITFPEVAPGPPIRLSASAYVAWRQCPEQAAARQRGEYGPESLPGFRGNLAHRVFARHLRDGPIDEESLALVCRQEIGSSNLNYKLGDLAMRPSVLQGVIEEVGALYQRFRRLPSEGFEAAEVNLEAEPVAGVSLVGTVDAVFRKDGSVRLVDWKTGNLGEVQDQLDFYTLVWALQHGNIPVAAEAVSVGTGERITLRFSTADLYGVAGRIARMATELRRTLETDQQLDLTGGPWCRYCVLLDRCPEGSATMDVLDPAAGTGQEETGTCES